MSSKNVKRRKAGRPTRFVPEVKAKVIEALEGGNFRNVACGYAGISYEVMKQWIAKGRSDRKGSYYDFYRAVIEAEKTAEIKSVKLIMQAAVIDPRHAQWWLSHRWPQRWADKTRVRTEVSGPNGSPIKTQTEHQFDVTRDQMEVLDAVLREVENAASNEGVGKK